MPGIVRDAVKTCNRCGQTKHVALFGRKGTGGRAARCKDCTNELARAEWKRRGNKPTSEQRHAHHIKYRYGITAAEYSSALEKQGGKCAICEALDSDGGRRLAIDHDHESGAIRGLLCRACNRAIGGFRESRELMLKAVAYLEATRHAPIPLFNAKTLERSRRPCRKASA